MKKTISMMVLIGVLSAEEFNPTYVWRTALFSTIITSYAVNIFHADEGSVEYGYNSQVNFVKANVVWKDPVALMQVGDFALNDYKVVSYGKWLRNDDGSEAYANNHIDANLLYRISNQWIGLEYSLGLSLMSNASMDRNTDLGWLYFNNTIGMFARLDRWYVFARHQHYSTNGITYPNPGYNFMNVAIGWQY